MAFCVFDEMYETTYFSVHSISDAEQASQTHDLLFKPALKCCLVFKEMKKGCHSERSRRQAAKSKNPFIFAIFEGGRILPLACNQGAIATGNRKYLNPLRSATRSLRITLYFMWSLIV